ncbi:MAG: hypothetical protein HQ582_08525 [Planctomycetes bacterium]|nr:hypothetical protein [Planctomycetota bacterium]
MTSEKRTLVFPVLLIAVGVGWLLTVWNVAPGIDWPWTLGLAAVGLLAFVVGGCDKVTVVAGPFFIIGSGLSLLRQTGRLNVDAEIPLLAISAGVLLLIARSRAIPIPRWILEAAGESRKPPDQDRALR